MENETMNNQDEFNQNSITIKTSLLVLDTDKPILETVYKLRGFISNKFSEYPIFHNHLGENRYIYTYPRVQYKIVNGRALILGIEEGTKLIRMLSEIKRLHLGDNIYNIKQNIFYDKEEEIMQTRHLLQYRFLTPWLALNKENYTKFRMLRDKKEKKIMINNIIIGNILSMSKGLGLDIEREIFVHSKTKEVREKYKDAIVSCFVGEFRTNIKIPDFFGLGKGASHGFGVVKIESVGMLPLENDQFFH